MIESISQERWEDAQSKEINHYDYNNEENYKNTTLIILRDHFKIDVDQDLIGKKILESGGGCYPSIYFCKGLKKSVNVEPLYDKFPDHVKTRFKNSNVECVSIGFEDYKGRSKFDEVWFFNVLQHVRDPFLQIENAKKIATTIRVFEPVDTAIDTEHPHSFNVDFFKDQFPESEVKIYHGGSIARFHGANCVYLTWTKNDKKKTAKS